MGKVKLLDSRFTMSRESAERAMRRLRMDFGGLYKGLELPRVLNKLGFITLVDNGRILGIGYEKDELPGIEAVRVLNAVSELVDDWCYLVWETDEDDQPIAWIFTTSGLRVRRATLAANGTVYMQDVENNVSAPSVILIAGRETGPKASITVHEDLAYEVCECIRKAAAESDTELEFDEVACRLVLAGLVFDGSNEVINVTI